MKPFSSPSVSIDGEAIRRIREEGRLTQLYVAKVVGVTTDTVSRWENNRYPTIRRDNALKLAEALDTELEKILQPVAPADFESLEAPEVSNRRFSWIYLVPVIVLIVLASGYLLFFRQTPIAVSPLKGHRFVPHFIAPGARVPIRLELNSEKQLKGLIIREEFPPGWNLVEAEPPATSVDNLNGSVRWMLRKPTQHQQVVYVLQAPLDSLLGSEISLHGEVVANPDGQQFSQHIASSGPLKIMPLHWADIDGDSRIDDLEILEVSDRVEESQNIHFGWDLIEKIWDAGGYIFDSSSHEYLPRSEPEPSSP